MSAGLTGGRPTRDRSVVRSSAAAPPTRRARRPCPSHPRRPPPSQPETVPAPEPEDVARTPIAADARRRARPQRRRTSSIAEVARPPVRGMRCTPGPSSGAGRPHASTRGSPASRRRSPTSAPTRHGSGQLTSNELRQRASTHRLPAEADDNVRTRPIWFVVRFEERAIARSPRLTRLTWPATPQPGLSQPPVSPNTGGFFVVRRRGRSLPAVAGAADGDDVVGAELAAEVADVDVDDVRARGRSPFPTRG